MKSGAPSSPSPPRSCAPPSCPVCRSLQLKDCPPGRDRLFGLATGSFTLLCCRSCGCIFQDPLPGVAALEKFYPAEYWWSENLPQHSRAARLFRKLEKSYRGFVIRDHVRFLAQCASRNPAGERTLLDIGCGNGTFLNAARAQGFSPHGMDASTRAVEIAGAQYGIPVRQGVIGSGVWSGSRFDFVTMFHVLEHLPDPKSALNYAKGLLRPGGVLIIQVPNAASAQARLFGRYWYGLDVPRHVINFTPKALSLLLNDAGFNYEVLSRFSLRDNPASIASSICPALDPVRRQASGSNSSPVLNGLAELAYFGIFLLALPPAFAESAFGLGGTLWVCARPS